MGVKLSGKDYSHLEKFRKALDSTHKIGRYVSHNGFGKGNDYCSLTIKNQKIVSDLQKCGITYRKSKAIHFPPVDVLPQE